MHYLLSVLLADYFLIQSLYGSTLMCVFSKLRRDITFIFKYLYYPRTSNNGKTARVGALGTEFPTKLPGLGPWEQSSRQKCPHARGLSFHIIDWWSSFFIIAYKCLKHFYNSWLTYSVGYTRLVYTFQFHVTVEYDVGCSGSSAIKELDCN